MRFLKWLLIGIITLFLSIPVVLVIFGSSKPHATKDLQLFADRLNEAAAIQIPHGFLMSEELRAGNLPLLEKVEKGVVLSAAESANYRAVFQQNLLESQSFLGRFDGELTVLNDWRMGAVNNVGTDGIAGKHDHHDESARRNYEDVERALARLDGASGPLAFLQRIAAINLANKSLADIISHMGVAPHTVSVAYEAPSKTWREQVTGDAFEAMMKAYKASQFQLVNSASYWQSVDQAVQQYALLVGEVQVRLQAKSSWWERRIAGGFLAPQTLAPQIDEDIPFRR